MAPALPVARDTFAWRAAVRGEGWAGHLTMLGFGTLCALMLFARDFGDMAAIWWQASTFNHCLLIPFIIVWLVQQRAPEVALIRPIAWLPGTAFVFVAALVWMVGEAADIGQLRHAGIILILQALVLTIVGPSITRALLFPLFYLCFLVPAGEELVPFLQTLTAKMSMALLAVTGIPAHINGVFITIPNGYFKVAEACSGVKFLIAMIAYGALVANVCFRSWPRRIAFMSVCIIVPILANGLRAFATIYYAHLTSEEAAASMDHVIYGWFFFALVIAMVMGLGWRFFDRDPLDLWLADFKPFGRVAAICPRRALIFAVAAILVPLIWQAAIAASHRDPMVHPIALPTVAGWERIDPVVPHWQPHYAGADQQALGAYRNAAGDQVDLAISVFAWQEEGRELVGFGQGAVAPDGPWSWTANSKAPPMGKAERIITAGPIDREVLTFYVTNRRQTGSVGQVKMDTLKSRLVGGDQAVAVILVSAVDRPERDARKAIDAFVTTLGSPALLARRAISTARGH
jgi:exosortase A